MARVDIKKTSGLPLVFDNCDLVSSELAFECRKDFFISDVKKELLNDDVTNPSQLYSYYCNFDKEDVYKSKGIKINVYIIMPNLTGIEYVKTLGSVAGNSHRIYEIASGGGILLAQNFSSKSSEDIFYTSMKKGSKALVPSDYDCAISNTKSVPLVVVELTTSECQTSNELDDMKGMSYYVIRKNAKQEIVRNPEYRLVERPRRLNFEKVLHKFGISTKTPIIKQILRKYEKFSWFINTDTITI